MRHTSINKIIDVTNIILVTQRQQRDLEVGLKVTAKQAFEWKKKKEENNDYMVTALVVAIYL